MVDGYHDRTGVNSTSEIAWFCKNNVQNDRDGLYLTVLTNPMKANRSQLYWQGPPYLSGLPLSMKDRQRLLAMILHLNSHP